METVLARHVVGDWQGRIPMMGGIYRLVLRLRLGPRGDLLAFADVPEVAALAIPCGRIALDGSRFRTDLPRGLALTGEFRDGLSELVGEVVTPQGKFPLELRRNRADWLPFEFPRVDASGQPIRTYTYQAPPRLDDGIDVGTMAEAGIDGERIHELMAAVLLGAYAGAHGLLILKNGKLVVEEYTYGTDRDLVHSIQSCTKSMTSLLIGQAMAQGAISGLDAPVYTFFPEHKGRRWIDERYPIALRHLLTMTAALDWNEKIPYADPRNDNTRMNASPDPVGYILDRRVEGEPGKRYSYTSGLSILLGAILKNTTGLYADQFAAKYLFPPLGITRHNWWHMSDGTCHTGGGLSLRPRDFARIGLMVLNDGVWDGRQVVPAAWVRESTSLRTAPDDYGYGYQWHIRTFDTPNGRLEAACAAGYGGQYMYVFRPQNVVVVLTGGDWMGGGAHFQERMDRFIVPAVM